MPGVTTFDPRLHDQGQQDAGGGAIDYGANNEKLPQDLQNELLGLVQKFSQEGRWARRQEVRTVRQARFFWRGIQYIFWSEKDQNWHLPTEQKIIDQQSSLDDMPRYQYVTNIYQAFGLSVIAPLSANVPRVRFFPESAQSPDDVAAAKAASRAARLIERTNDIRRILGDEAYFAWCDGKIGLYVRYVADGERFGWEDQPEFGERQKVIQPAALVCSECGAETPMADAALMGEALCQQCGASLSPANFRAEQVVNVPQATRMLRCPKGQVVVTPVGSLELKTPIWVRDQADFHFLMYDVEVHYSKLRAKYPHVAEKIQGGSPSPGEDTFERIARVSTAQGTAFRTQTGDALYNLITFGRTWMRPDVFKMVENKEARAQLEALFPDGCYVAFAGTTYCESRNESMDDHWVVRHALPGDGQNRPSVGESMMSVQERFNDLTNLMMETYDYGIPVTWADQEAVDFDALEEQIAEPGSYQPIALKPGETAGEKFFTPPPASVPPDMLRHTMDLFGPVGQFLTGAFPALMGADAKGGGETATGYAMQRDQAMGRIGIVWRMMREMHARALQIGVECLRENATEDIEVPKVGKGSEFEPEWIRLAELKGSFKCFPEGDENFPELWMQKRGTYMQLLQDNDPDMKRVIMEPDNQALGKELIGLQDFVLPGADSRDKQHKEIKQLLAGVLVEVDPFLDNHAVELEVCKVWANSDEGQRAKEENPEGFAAVRAHAVAHAAAMQPVPTAVRPVQAGGINASE